VQAGQFDAASKTLSVVANELIAQGNTSALMESLRLIRSKSPQHAPALELIYRICDQSGDVNAQLEILEALGHSYLQSGQFQKARQAFQKLLDHDPGNEHYDVLLKDVLQKQSERFGKAPVTDLPSSAIDLTAEQAPLPPSPPVPATDREGMVREALDNSELFARYHLLSRAVAGLDRVLEVYPDEIEIHKRLVGMCWKDLPERAEQAAHALAMIYTQQGDAEGARRFAQIAGEPDTAAALAVRLPALRVPAKPPGPELLPPNPEQAAQFPPGEANATSEFSPAPSQEGQQASLDSDLPPDSQASPSPEPPLDPATLGPDTSPPASDSEIQMLDLSQELEAFLAAKGAGDAASESPQQAPSFNFDESRIEISFYLEQGFFEEARGAVKLLEEAFRGDPRITELRSLVEAYTAGGAFEPSPKPPTAAQELSPSEVARPGEEAVDQREPASSPAAPEPEGQPGAAQDASVPEPGSEDDAEAHFNLGMAFWEMKLPDQAIGEFQKAVHGAGKISQPAHFLQACSLLAACFMEKGMAPIAVKWYCRALETPHLDQEARLALQYDLGVAYERAGDLPRALEMFSEVYGQRIDYRDVAEKIRALQQKAS
jgi:tetratricopeptide (TPR) repeat protein